MLRSLIQAYALTLALLSRPLWVSAQTSQLNGQVAQCYYKRQVQDLNIAISVPMHIGMREPIKRRNLLQ